MVGTIDPADTTDPAAAPGAGRWRKSSFSSSTSNCVEVAFSGAGAGVRDSKNTSGPVLVFPAGAWRAFVHPGDSLA